MLFLILFVCLSIDFSLFDIFDLLFVVLLDSFVVVVVVVFVRVPDHFSLA